MLSYFLFVSKLLVILLIWQIKQIKNKKTNSDKLSTQAIASACDIDEGILQGYQRVEAMMILTGSIRMRRETFLIFFTTKKLC